MTIDFTAALTGYVAGNLPSVWHAVPNGVKVRLEQGFDRLTGKVTRRWDRENKSRDADVDDGIKRAGNKSDAQKEVLKLLVPDVAKKISADPVLLERATLEMMGNAYINQENRESVAEVALKDVVDKHDDHSESSEPQDEDWLNIFSSYAEKASTERTRQLWGRILSGEVRHQGRFSLSTLRILSEIDKKIANNFSEHACLFFSNGSLPYSIEKINENEIDFIGMQECGIIDSLSTNRKTNFTPDMDLTCSISMDNILINILFRAKITAHINTIFLTKSGCELCHLIDAVPNIQRQAQAVSEAIKENHIISKCSIFEIKQVKTNGFVDYFTPAIIDWEK